MSQYGHRPPSEAGSLGGVSSWDRDRRLNVKVNTNVPPIHPTATPSSSSSSSATHPYGYSASPSHPYHQHHQHQSPPFARQSDRRVHQEPFSPLQRSAPAVQPYSPSSAPQDQLERLAAEASSVAGGITGVPFRPDSPHRNSSVTRSLSAGSSTSTPGPSRERLQLLRSVPEDFNSSTAACRKTSPPPMSSTRAIPRTSSIDSAISSVSAQSGISHSHSASNASTLSNMAGNSPADIQSLIQAAGSAEDLIKYMLKDKSSLTAQNAQLWRLVDKQRAMILGLNKDLERALKDKERYRKKLKDQLGSAAYPLPSAANITNSRATSESPVPSLDEPQDSLGANGIVRSESMPLPGRERQGSSSSSLLDINIAPYPVTPPPPPVNQQPTSHVKRPHLISVNERMPSPTEHVRNIIPSTHGKETPESVSTPLGSKGSDQSLRSRSQQSRAAAATSRPSSPKSEPTEEVTVSQPDVQVAESPISATPNTSPPISPSTTIPVTQLGRLVQERSPEPVAQPLSARKLMQHPKALGITTAVAPVSGLGKSPLRKAPPAPLELTPQPESKPEDIPEEDEEADLDNISIKEIEGYARARVDDETQPAATSDSDNSWQATPDDKKMTTKIVASRELEGPLSAPPGRPAPTSKAVEKRPSTPSEANHGALASPRIRQQFVKAPLPSPGLPSSPRPIDRPANSPMPRSSRIEPLSSPRPALPGSPKPNAQTFSSFRPSTPRQIVSMHGMASPPLASPRSIMDDRERVALVQSPPGVSNDSDSSGQVELLIQPSAIPSIDSRVVVSRMRPSRASMIAGNPRSSDETVFTLGVFSRADGKEMLRVEKDARALDALDSVLRKHISISANVPDHSLFSGHAPARVDARRAAIDEYFSKVLGATMVEGAALALCTFFSTDVAESGPGSGELTDIKADLTGDSRKAATKLTKEGYLTKRGKNFGGWKERYFILDGPILKYFDGPGGAHLGQIKLQHAQIGRQSASQRMKESTDDSDVDSQYRHAFLVLEPKRKDSSTLVRHVLCAESDTERDEWVEALLQYVDKDDPGEDVAREAKKKTRPAPRKQESKEDTSAATESLLAMSYAEANQGPAPARGPTPDEIVANRHYVSPSPSSSMLSHPSHSSASLIAHPADRGHPHKQISAPSNGSVISDLAAWGAKLAAPSDKSTKKRSIWGFRQRSSSDLSNQVQGPQQMQQTSEKFVLSRAVFGASLEEAVHMTKPSATDMHLPAVVYRCIEYLDAKHASEEEGIFRLSGSNVVIKGLKERFNTESDYNLLAAEEYYDVHAVAGLLKLYLRELPTNVLTSERRDDFVKVTEMDNKNRKIIALNELVHNLPIENFHLLKALSGHLLRIVDNADINKMTIRNVGIVFSPTLNIPAQVFSMFLHEYSQIFVQDVDVPSSPPPRDSSDTRPSFSSLRNDAPSTPLMAPPTPQQRHPPPQQSPQTPTSYEPSYEQIVHQGGGTGGRQRASDGARGLSIPADATALKARRRESSMMLMMGGGPRLAGANSLVTEDSLYE